MPAPLTLLLSCEHGGNQVPTEWRALFRGHQSRLNGHSGYDLGALDCARALARRLAAPLLYAVTTRLLVDLNRSPHHPRLFSDITRALPRDAKQKILRRHYLPHRDRVEARIAELIGCGNRVLHVAFHSFTPVLDGVVRNADIALLYDPARRLELRLCRSWQRALARDSAFLVRRNFPYRGVSDGLTRYLRTRFRPDQYAGIELELNQGLLNRRRDDVTALYSLLAGTLRETLRQANGSAAP